MNGKMIAGNETFFSFLYRELDQAPENYSDEEYKMYLKILIRRIFKIFEDDQWKMTAGTKLTHWEKWIKKANEPSGIYMWRFDKGGVLFHEIPGWNSTPAPKNPNYINKKEKALIEWIWSETKNLDDLNIKLYLMI